MDNSKSEKQNNPDCKYLWRVAVGYDQEHNSWKESYMCILYEKPCKEQCKEISK